MFIRKEYVYVCEKCGHDKEKHCNKGQAIIGCSQFDKIKKELCTCKRQKKDITGKKMELENYIDKMVMDGEL